MNRIKQLLIILALIFTFTESSIAQIISPTGVTSRQSSQLIFYYAEVDDDDEGVGDDFIVGGDDASTVIQIANTNSEGRGLGTCSNV